MQLFKSILEKTIEPGKAGYFSSQDMEFDSRRIPIDRRQYSYTKHLPERRDANRRKGEENRRNGQDRRSGDDRRNADIISEKE